MSSKNNLMSTISHVKEAIAGRLLRQLLHVHIKAAGVANAPGRTATGFQTAYELSQEEGQQSHQAGPLVGGWLPFVSADGQQCDKSHGYRDGRYQKAGPDRE